MSSTNTYDSLKPIYKESYADSKKKRFSKVKKTVKKQK